jgi:hypothetical protein
MNAAARQIEGYLLRAGGWVSSRDLQLVFGISERALRRDGNQPGLCSEFAISGVKGFRHVKNATDEEFSESYRRARKHGIGELVGARKRKAYRERLLTTPPPEPVLEIATGQAVML